MEYLELAVGAAVRNVHNGGEPFGAVVVTPDGQIHVGTNRMHLDPDPTGHAEIVAIRAAAAALGRSDLTGCRLYSSCEPCPMCLAAAYWAHIERIVFACTRDDAAAIGFDDAFLYRELVAPPAARRVPELPLLRDEGLVAFREWTANPRRIAY